MLGAVQAGQSGNGSILRIQNVNVPVAVSRDRRLPLIPVAIPQPYLRGKFRRRQCRRELCQPQQKDQQNRQTDSQGGPKLGFFWLVGKSTEVSC